MPLESHSYLVRQLGEIGLANPHVVEGQLHSDRGGETFDVGALRTAFGSAYIANNSYNRQKAIDATSSGQAGMITFGKLFIGSPDLAERLRRNAPLCEAPESSYFRAGAEGYTELAHA